MQTKKSIIFFLFSCLLFCTAPAWAQSAKLPAPDKIIDAYWKALGGKKKVAALRDAGYEWQIVRDGQPAGTAQSWLKAPSSARWSLKNEAGEVMAAATGTSAWARRADGTLRTLTTQESGPARLWAVLDASRLIDVKKQTILARTVTLDASAGEPSYVVEFTVKTGAKLRYWFGRDTRLLRQITTPEGKLLARLSDYRAENGVQEAHTLERDIAPLGLVTFKMQRASYNQNLADAFFDPPRDAENIDIAALLREIQKNQQAVDERVSEYYYVQKETQRELSGKGELKKETIRVYEVFPVPGQAPVRKMVSENGQPLSAERVKEEEKKATEALVKAEKERAKQKAKDDEKKAKESLGGDPNSEEDDGRNLQLKSFLKMCEFVAPRREMFRGRENIVFDFRPKPGVKPANRNESTIAKMVGVVWVDAQDKEISRLEARFKEGLKVGGGLIVSVKPGAAFVIEQQRQPEGVWFPVLASANLSIRLFLVSGNEVNTTLENNDFRKFNTDVKGYELKAPPKPE
jgi:outer membrane lipoprotein-sorting protein